MGFIYWRPGRSRIVGLVAILVLSGVALWKMLEQREQATTNVVARSLKEHEYKPEGESNPFRVAVAHKVLARLATSFVLLRTPPEGLPPKLRSIMRRPSYGMNWDLAQRAPISPMAKLWLVPGSGFLCILALFGEDKILRQSCSPTRMAVASGVAIVTINAHPRKSPSGSRSMIGIAPDQAKQVVVRTGGSVIDRPVAKWGIFTLRDSIIAPPDLLTFR